MKPNERKPVNHVPSEVDTNSQRNAQVSVPPASSTTTNVDDSGNAAYREGYVQGRVVENARDRHLRDRDNENAARGLLLGILLASLVGLVAGTLYYLSQRDESPVPAIVPVPQETDPQPPQTIERERTIIERVVPIPQEAPQAPADRAEPTPEQPPEQPQPSPDINITVPNSQTQEAPPQQPAPAPASPPQSEIEPPEMRQETNPTPEAPAEPAAPPASSTQVEETPEAQTAPETEPEQGSESPVNESAEPASESGFAIPADSVE